MEERRHDDTLDERRREDMLDERRHEDTLDERRHQDTHNDVSILLDFLHAQRIDDGWSRVVIISTTRNNLSFIFRYRHQRHGQGS